jgi:hypothetical protein
MPLVPDVAAAATGPADIRGLVDNATDKGLYGWAWNARRPGERVTVELRLDGRALTSALADGARPDLAQAGIGDGAHAFALRLAPEWLARRDELAVVARAADGTEVGVPIRTQAGEAGQRKARPQDVGPSPTQLLRGLEALAASQRQMLQSLQDIAARQPERTEVESVAAAQRDLADRLAALEQWLARLDDRLASGAAAPAVSPGSSGVTSATALFGTLAAVSLGAIGVLALAFGG